MLKLLKPSTHFLSNPVEKAPGEQDVTATFSSML